MSPRDDDLIQDAPAEPEVVELSPEGVKMFALLRQARELSDAGKDDEAAPLYDQIAALEASIA